MENITLHIYFQKKDEADASLVQSILGKQGYKAELCKKAPNQEDFCIIILSENSDKDSMLEDIPWLKEQFDYSSYRLFRLMPMLVYGGENNLDRVWENGVGEIYEAIFSGEFKPFGFDKESGNPLKEFPRILEEYL